jgi:hypothetical protein
MEFTKQQMLAWEFDRHGYGTVEGYGENGYGGTWFLRSLADVARLPSSLVYIWKS